MDKNKLKAFSEKNELKSLNHDHYNEVIEKHKAKLDAKDAEIKVLNDKLAQLEKFKAKKVKELVSINSSKKKLKFVKATLRQQAGLSDSQTHVTDTVSKENLVNSKSRGHAYLMEGQYQFLKKVLVDEWGFEKYIERTKELDAFAVEYKERKLRLDAERSRQHLERNLKG